MNPRMALFSASLPGWSAREVIDTASLLGFPAVEWGTGPEQAIEDPRSGAEIRERCTRAGLACAGVAIQDSRVSLATPQAAMAAVELAATLEAQYVRVSAPHYRGEALAPLRQLTRDGLATLVAAASARGLAILVETSPGTLAPTPEAALAVVDGHAPTDAGVLYDPGNMIIEGHVQPCLAVAHLQEYLLHVHVKSVAWACDGDGWRWDYARLDGGMTDWPSIVEALAGAGYPGRFAIDHLPGPPTERLLRDEAEALSGLLASAFPAPSHREVASGHG